jgi:hypothetical protein
VITLEIGIFLAARHVLGVPWGYSQLFTCFTKNKLLVQQ